MKQTPIVLFTLFFLFSCGDFLGTSKKVSKLTGGITQAPGIEPLPEPEPPTLKEQVQALTGNQLWLDSKNEGSLRTDENCSILAAEGDNVGCWLDLSGQGHHLVQDKNNNKPDYQSEGIYFDGNDFLIDEDGGDYINGSTAFEIFAVVKSDEINSDRAFWDTENRDQQDDVPSFRYDKKGWLNGCDQCLKLGVKTNQGASASESGSYLQTLNSHLVNASWNSGSYPKIYDHGVESVSTNPINVSGEIVGATRVMIGDGTKKAWKGNISEVLYYNRQLSVEERAIVVQYLQEKWNL